MTLATVVFNGQSLQMFIEDERKYQSPAYVHISEEGLIAGEEARRLAWLEPQNSYTRHWDQLDEKPLDKPTRWARHHADLSFFQLSELLSKIDSPELLVAIPSSFNDRRLQLLLGLIEAVPAKTCGVIESALLCAEDYHRAIIQLHGHQTVISHLENTGQYLQILNSEVISDIGALQLLKNCARYISERSILATRYDPMHSAVAQQNLFNQLPSIIDKFKTSSESIIDIKSPDSNFTLHLDLKHIQQMLDPKFEVLKAALKDYETEQLCLTPQSGLLKSLCPALREVKMPEDTFIERKCMRLATQAQREEKPLQRLNQVLLSQISDQTIYVASIQKNKSRGRIATHLLHDRCAWPLSSILSFSISRDRLFITGKQHTNADLVLSFEDGNLLITYKKEHLYALLPSQVLPGESLHIGKHQLTLIEVVNA
tara:strand:+ start:2316 stop:3599 length:1284 start_codon:yes stop_codon:yes gene_type:complete